MSLINEALKKAQRSRGDGQPGETAAPFGGDGPVAKRGKARSSQTIVLIASGAIVLVVLTVVATFWFSNRPAPQPEKVVAKKPAPKTAGTSDTPPIVVPPMTPAPVTTPTTSTNPGPSAGEKSTKAGETQKGEATTATAETKSGAAPVAPAPTTPTTTPASGTATTPNTATASAPPAPPSPVAPNSNPPPATTPAGAGAGSAPNGSEVAATAGAATQSTTAPSGGGKQDERIATYVEGLRITAIRANDAKIIMNEKVYRVNDIVDRNLGVRLIKVAADSLTFADANGVTYVKYF